MRLGAFFSATRAFKARLNLKWSDYWNDIVQSIAEEEVGIRRHEYDKHIESGERERKLLERTGMIAPD